MRKGVSGFNSERLTQVRKFLGITRNALASLVGVSPATISNWEKGTQAPENEKLSRLSEVVNFPESWFLKDIASHGEKPYFFRSQASTAKSARGVSQMRLDFLSEISGYLSKWLVWPKVNIPFIEETNPLNISDVEVEKMAAKCREVWGLGLGPINNVVLTLENAGVIFTRNEIGYVKMDGVSRWSETDGHPYVLVAADKANGIRSRFDAAHELGHLVLHRYVDGSHLNSSSTYKEIERQADLFAGCFLMPSESFVNEVVWPTLDNFLTLKRRWKCSIASMIMRCYQLGIIDDDTKLRLFKGISARGWRKGEPYDDQVPFEMPRLLNRAVSMLVDNSHISKGELAFQLGLPKELIADLCGLPENYFSERPQAENLVELKLKPRGVNSSLGKSGSVLGFPKRNN
ncbi:helix-turn-helix domain-containing protein [Marinibactrum halimedae]|uniref:Transcriptional regulator n=1 Tax=Marinibactrum halimedae TaxID=1444977 RepID=A0AA37TAC2_9GAMM|nr:XRE family transcriptional regulator [Marinibactrum halimedae]MCD9458904.1 XRE family transcriptional regulator [Marinibactrum halimedae]GLS27752.1 transcriptional regulator [Marinibactrum halimedae]